MIYHWDGYESFRLTHRGPPRRTFNVSGISLVVLKQTVGGALTPCALPITFGTGVSGSALRSDASLVMQVTSPPGWQSVEIDDSGGSDAGRVRTVLIDAVTGERASDADSSCTRENGKLSLRFRVPATVNGADKAHPSHLAYLVISRVG
jgi:hypothetical protein